MINYFTKDQKRMNILNKIKKRRIIINNYQVPLGIYPAVKSKPTEGYYLEKKEDNSYTYRISISAEKIEKTFIRLLSLFPEYGSMIIERKSEDINRKIDVFMSDPDTSKEKIKKIFKRYKELWVECAFVGFGILDINSKLEVFINLDKEIIISSNYYNIKKINRILRLFKLYNNKKVSFLSDYEHWHYSLSSIVADEIHSKNEEYIFDYYDIINNLRHNNGLSIINLYDDEIKLKPKWWSVTVKGLGKCEKIAFISTYYIVANTFEEMETIIFEKMKSININYYYLYDYYNVKPINYSGVNLTNSDDNIFENAKVGIWAESDIYIYKTRNTNLYYLNKKIAWAI